MLVAMRWTASWRWGPLLTLLLPPLAIAAAMACFALFDIVGAKQAKAALLALRFGVFADAAPAAPLVFLVLMVVSIRDRGHLAFRQAGEREPSGRARSRAARMDRPGDALREALQLTQGALAPQHCWRVPFGVLTASALAASAIAWAKTQGGSLYYINWLAPIGHTPLAACPRAGGVVAFSASFRRATVNGGEPGNSTCFALRRACPMSGRCQRQHCVSKCAGTRWPGPMAFGAALAAMALLASGANLRWMVVLAAALPIGLLLLRWRGFGSPVKHWEAPLPAVGGLLAAFAQWHVPTRMDAVQVLSWLLPTVCLLAWALLPIVRPTRATP